MPASAWQFVGRTATLRTPELIASIDVDCPSAGLRIESICGQPVAPTAIFGVQIDPGAADRPAAAMQPADCFARGNDFIATYAEARDRPFRAQIYWRLLDRERPGNEPAAAAIAGLELIVSVQTSRLDIETALSVCSTLGDVEAWQLLDANDERSNSAGLSDGLTDLAPSFQHGDCPSCCLIRRFGSSPSYVEMVHPSDFRQTTFEWASESPPVVRLSHRLFAERLEKGVILRSRIRCLFVPRSHASELARAEYRRFAASEPPLAV